MTVRLEDVAKRERRWKREARMLAQFERSKRHYDGFTYRSDICRCYSLPATWSAARRVATEVIRWPVDDVRVAWGILAFVDKLPDRDAHLRAAVERATAQWHTEIEALAPPQVRANRNRRSCSISIREE